MPLSYRIIYHDKAFHQKSSGNDDGNVVPCFSIRTVRCRNHWGQSGYRKEGSTNYDELITYTDGYKQLGLYAVIAGVVLILISPFVKKLMQDVK